MIWETTGPTCSTSFCKISSSLCCDPNKVGEELEFSDSVVLHREAKSELLPAIHSQTRKFLHSLETM